MKIFKQLFCKHNYQHYHNLSIPLNDDWPCKVQHVDNCSKCGKEKTVSQVIGARK